MTAAVSLGQQSEGYLALLVDQNSSHQFLVDTGSVYSIIPHSSTDTPTGPKIMGADKTPIPCWGCREFTIRVGVWHFTWQFLMAKVAFPIIGSDFLRSFDMAVDLKRMC